METSPASTPPVERERDGGLTILRISRPENMNALTDEVKQAMGVYIPEFLADTRSRCLLLTGSATAFCAGGDLRTLRGGHTQAQTRARMQRSHSWLQAALAGGKPIITAVNGAAVGAGFSLALLGDIVLASHQAYFQAGFTAVGVAADLGLPLTLSRSVGLARAKEILFSNRRLAAAEAVEIGLIARSLPAEELIPEAVRLGRQLAAAPTLAVGLTKGLLNAAYELNIPDYLEAETAAQCIAFASADCIEGVEAFFAKRQPSFRGE